MGESVREPLNYYHTNINTTLNLVDCMLRHDVNRLVFSSSATVYGEPEQIPIDESAPIVDATNPYSRSKLFIEKILEDVDYCQNVVKEKRERCVQILGFFF